MRKPRFSRKKDVYNPKPKKRIIWIDYLRSIAILLMIITHTVVVFYNYENTSIFDSTLENVSLIGGTVAFTLFLFISGSTIFHVFLSKQDKQFSSKYIVRSIRLLLIFYLLSIFLNYALNIIFLDKNIETISKDLVNVFLFIKLPPLAEFLIPFIVLPLIIMIFAKPIRKLLELRIALPIVGLTMFGLGTFLSRIDISNEILIAFKSLLFGTGEDIHTFPIFQYSLVYLLGISFAYEYQKIKVGSKRLAFNSVLAIAGIGSVLISYVLYSNNLEIQSLNISWYSGRFPPSLPFILYGLILAILLLVAYEMFQIISSKTKLVRVHKLVPYEKFLLYIGQHALTFYFLHILILGVPLILENRFNANTKSDSTLRTIVIYTVIVLFIYLISKIIDSSKLTRALEPISKSVVLVIPFIIGVLMISSVFGLASYYVGVQPDGASMKLDRIIKYSNAEMWWEDSYASRANVDISNQNTRKFYVELNKNELIQSGITLNSNMNNFRVVQQSMDSFIELPSSVELQGDNLKVYFEISDFENEEIFIYTSSNYEPTKSVKLSKSGDYKRIVAEAFIPKSVNIKMENDWYLKSWDDGSLKDVSINSSLFYQDVLSAELSVIGTNIVKELGLTTSTSQVSLSELDQLEPGRYGIQAKYVVFENSIKVYKSNIFYVNVSYPLFVNWSIDWEGYGVGQGDLDDIANISDVYGMDVTHYFNPRIYISNQYSFNSIDPGSAQYLTNWILNRRNQHGDEIGLHIHMFQDLEDEINSYYTPESIESFENEVDSEGESVESTERIIEANPNSVIQGLARTENKLQGYPEEDLVLIFEWSLNKFKEKGLGMPTSFRSGAWMSGTNVLKALAKNGIKIDSTGRTGGLLNPNVSSSSPIPWNLSITQKPYYPNINDINSSASPTIDILEVPNNGADSYWFSHEEMIDRFQQNFNTYSNNGYMTEPQIVTYLSHPHGFSIYDSQKIRSTFDHISQSSYKSGNGPVVFTTLEKIYNNFDVAKF